MQVLRQAGADRFRQGNRWIVALLLAAGTLVLYLQVTGHQFLFYDDDRYVTRNEWVRGGLSLEGVRWALTTFHVANWHPLTWLSHMLDVQLFGVVPGAHHLVNALFHAANAGLLFLTLTALTGAPARSALVAALFAVHPLHVESVAWVSERKEVLGAMFGFLMLRAYARYAKAPRFRNYLPVLLCFALSLLSKPMWVTAPFLLLLLDYWPLHRIEDSPVHAAAHGTGGGRVRFSLLVAEKIPMFALSILSSAVTVAAQHRGGALVPTEMIGIGPRLGNAIVSYVRYLAKAFWPTPLALFYPFPPGGPPAWQVAAAAALLVLVSTLALFLHRNTPWLPVGWFWFLGTLFPVIGLVQVGSQGMADRYAYLPVIGLWIAVTWEGAYLAARWPARLRRRLSWILVAIVAALSVLTWRQIGYWSDQEVLFRHTVAVTEGNGRANLILSQALGEKGRYREALGYAEEAARLEPMYPPAHGNLGFLLYRAGRIDEAIDRFRRAILLQPDYAEAHYNLGIAYGKQGRVEEAMKEMALGAELRSRQSLR
jgi:hypothetical protein